MIGVLTNPYALFKASVILQPGIVASLILFEERASITKVVMQGSGFSSLVSYLGIAIIVFLLQIWALRAVAKPQQVTNDVVPQLLYFLGIVMGANAAIVLNSALDSPTLIVGYMYSSLTLFWASFLTTHEHAMRKRERQ